MKRGKNYWYDKYRNFAYKYDFEGDIPLDYFKKHIVPKYGVNRYCPHCLQMLVKSDIPTYPYLCLRCDENFYNFESYAKSEIEEG